MPESKKRKVNGKPLTPKKPVVAELEKLTCPHCDFKIVTIDWREYAERKVALIGCGNCKKVIGTSYNFSL